MDDGWKGDRYRNLGSHVSLDAVESAIADARALMESGVWRDMYFYCNEYEGSVYINMYGERKETEAEIRNRLEHKAFLARLEYETYERLKKIYG